MLKAMDAAAVTVTNLMSTAVLRVSHYLSMPVFVYKIIVHI
jgi:hypothetical protein